MFKPGDAVFWLDDDGEDVLQGTLIAIDLHSRVCSILRRVPNGAILWYFKGLCDLHETYGDVRRPAQSAPWSAERCTEELAAWMRTHGWNGKVSAALCGTPPTEFIVRLNNDVPNGRCVNGNGPTWCAAVQSAIELWEKRRATDGDG